MRILITGCGYVGLPLGQALAARGHTVHGVRRNPFTAEGITAHTADLTQPGTLDTLPRDFDWVINTVSSSRGGAEAHRAIFLDGTRNLLDWLDEMPARLIFTSSTSVYQQTDSQWVDEETQNAPATGTGATLTETEELFLNAAVPATILRVAGIYGPERGYLFRQFLKGEAVMTGPERWLNMIHRDDVISAILMAMEIEPGIYNATDNEPVTQLAFFEWLAEQTGKPLPPVGEAGPRKRAITNKRVRNAKLKATGWQLKYPTFREGFGALLANAE